MGFHRVYLGHPKPSKTLFLVPKNQVFWRGKPLFFLVLGAPGMGLFPLSVPVNCRE